MHVIYVRDLESRRPGVPLAVDIEDARLAERLVRSIASSYPRNGSDEPTACWFRDGHGLHRIWSEPVRGTLGHLSAAGPGNARSSAA